MSLMNIDLRGFEVKFKTKSGVFSAVSERTYYQIYCNPPQDMGNEFLDEMVNECFKHLKREGQVYFVIQKQLKSVIERLFKKYLGKSTIVATAKIHVVLTGQKKLI